MTRDRLVIIQDYVSGRIQFESLDEKALRDCVRELADAIKEAWDVIEQLKESLKWAANHDPSSSRACPLCTYKQGVFVEACHLHKEIAVLNEKAQRKAEK